MRPRVVVHIAGLAHREASDSEFERVNVGGTRNLLVAIDRLEAAPEAFVLASTVAVYGRDSGTLLDEDTTPQPSTAYGRSKLGAEELVRDWAGRVGARGLILSLATSGRTQGSRQSRSDDRRPAPWALRWNR